MCSDRPDRSDGSAGIQLKRFFLHRFVSDRREGRTDGDAEISSLGSGCRQRSIDSGSVIGRPAGSPGPEQLLDQHQACQFMGEGHWRQAQTPVRFCLESLVRPSAPPITKAIRSLLSCSNLWAKGIDQASLLAPSAPPVVHQHAVRRGSLRLPSREFRPQFHDAETGSRLQ